MQGSNLQVNCLFPSSVFVFDLEEHLFKLEQIKTNYEYIDNSYSGSIGVSKSITNNILDYFPEEKNIIMDYFNYIKNKFMMYENNNFKMTTSWGVRCVEKSFSQYHCHKNSFYSGIYYLEQTENTSYFEIDAYNLFPSMFEILPTKHNVYNSTFWKIPPKKSRLIFFPSYLNHRIGENHSSNTRYSIAFNIMPIGEIGGGDSFVKMMI